MASLYVHWRYMRCTLPLITSGPRAQDPSWKWLISWNARVTMLWLIIQKAWQRSLWPLIIPGFSGEYSLLEKITVKKIIYGQGLAMGTGVWLWPSSDACSAMALGWDLLLAYVELRCMTLAL